MAISRRSFIKLVGSGIALGSTVLSGCASLLPGKVASSRRSARTLASLDSGEVAPISAWRDEYVERLWTLPDSFPKNEITLTSAQRSHNTKKLRDAFSTLDEEFKSLPDDETKRQDWIKKISPQFREVFADGFALSEDEVNFFERKKIISGFVQFCDQVKKYDPTMNFRDIFQASRNSMTANLLQIIQGKSVDTHAGIVGYSLLYPYTDNYLDDPELNNADKLDFGIRFGNRLSGAKEEGRNPLESKIFGSVAMIESHFPRESYPEIYSSLLVIHDAQVESLKQQNASLGKVVMGKEFLGKSIGKGGASVLADAYLVAGKPSATFAKFSYGLGVALQFVDDIEDTRHDLRNKTASFFTVPADRGLYLDGYCNKVIHLCNSVLDDLASCSKLSSEETLATQKILKVGIYSMIADGVHANSEYFSEAYNKQIRKLAPVDLVEIEMTGVQTRIIQRFQNDGDRLMKGLRSYSAI